MPLYTVPFVLSAFTATLPSRTSLTWPSPPPKLLAGNPFSPHLSPLESASPASASAAACCQSRPQHSLSPYQRPPAPLPALLTFALWHCRDAPPLREFLLQDCGLVTAMGEGSDWKGRVKAAGLPLPPSSSHTISGLHSCFPVSPPSTVPALPLLGLSLSISQVVTAILSVKGTGISAPRIPQLPARTPPPLIDKI